MKAPSHQHQSKPKVSFNINMSAQLPKNPWYVKLLTKQWHSYIKSRNFKPCARGQVRFAVIIIRRLGLNDYIGEHSSECSVKLPIRIFWEPSDNILAGTFRPIPISPHGIFWEHSRKVLIETLHSIFPAEYSQKLPGRFSLEYSQRTLLEYSENILWMFRNFRAAWD